MHTQSLAVSIKNQHYTQQQTIHPLTSPHPHAYKKAQKNSPRRIYLQGLSNKKKAVTYSPTGMQYHRRARA